MGWIPSSTIDFWYPGIQFPPCGYKSQLTPIELTVMTLLLVKLKFSGTTI